jgi:LmbE family N-acetylglucosaminyl deacetylase
MVISRMIRLLKRGIRGLLIRNPTKANYKFIMKDWHGLFDLSLASSVLETKRFSQNLQSIELETPAGERILVLAPHPDDDVFGAGGMLLKSLRRGRKVHIVYVTNGSQVESLGQKIRREAEDVCRAMGVSCCFLNCAVRGIAKSDEAVNEKLAQQILTYKPDTLVTTFVLDDHDDHRRVNHLLMKALSRDDVKVALPKKTEVWWMQIYSTVLPNVVVDISEVEQEKRHLIGLWRSVSGQRDWEHYVMGLNAFNCRFIPRREKIYAEVFFVIPVAEFRLLCEAYFSNTNNGEI